MTEKYTMKFEEIKFDQDDKLLFLIDDLQLKADAIRYSILPKLEIIGNEIISRIIDIYNVNYYENCALAKSPNFRKSNRINDLKVDYKHSSVSLTGLRKWNKWIGLTKEGNKQANIVPFWLRIELNTKGLVHMFYYNRPKNFSKDTHTKIFNFLIENEKIIQTILYSVNIYPNFEWKKNSLPIVDFRNKLNWKLENELYDLFFMPATPIQYPIETNQLEYVIKKCILLFTIFQSFIDISLGEKPQLEKYIESYHEYILKQKDIDKTQNISSEINKINLSQDEIERLTINRIKVMPGIRWQVFKRDNWRCVACGKSADDNVILHIDHIIPRSKGGKDEINNYQTLCETCNIGKSNKDDTNLRNKSAYS